MLSTKKRLMPTSEWDPTGWISTLNRDQYLDGYEGLSLVKSLYQVKTLGRRFRRLLRSGLIYRKDCVKMIL